MLIPHRDTQTFVPENFPYRGRIEALPADVTPEQAIILALTGVALAAIHDARIKVGDRVAIFGLGVTAVISAAFSASCASNCAALPTSPEATVLPPGSYRPKMTHAEQAMCW